MYCQWNRWIAYFLLTGLLVGGPSFAVDAMPLTAQSKNVTYNPPNRGAPGQTQDAGSRPSCPIADIPFTAIAPATNWGETSSPHPTFWLYLPYPASSIEFTLSDENQQETLYHTTFPANTTAGIGQFSLPASAPPLEPDRLYRWQFTFICDAETQSYFQVSGVVVSRSLTDEEIPQLLSTSSVDHIAVLAELGLWYDAVAQLNHMRQLNPNQEDLESAWASLLQHPAVGLDALVSAPFIDCCSE